MTRKPIMAGNWKMNVNHVEATGLVEKLAWTLKDKGFDPESVDCVVLPPFTDLRTVQTLVESEKMPISVGAQDVSAHLSGAYTGEVSAAMLAKLNCKYVVIGHSERRQYHGETDDLINKKAKQLLEHGLVPIICCGEGLDIRKLGQQVPYTLEQVKGDLAGIPADQVASLVIAYEPVWAIGTGEVATPQDAQEVCAAIRGCVKDLYDEATGEAVRIQYGGSVKASNTADIMAQPDVDGALVGGASLQPEEFANIVLFAKA